MRSDSITSKSRLIIESLLIGVVLGSSFTYPLPAKAQILPTIESLEQKIEKVSLKYKIASSTLYNLVLCESNLDPKADNGEDRGLVQINRKAWPDITDEQAFDPDFALNFAAEKISEGKGYIWTCGNCYSFALNELGKLPKMSDIVPNSNYPRIGGLTIFDYNGKKHVSVNKKIVEEGIIVKECNFTPNLCSTRLVKWEDEHIKGYWSSPDIP